MLHLQIRPPSEQSVSRHRDSVISTRSDRISTRQSRVLSIALTSSCALRTHRRFCEFPPPNTSASPNVGCSAREKSKPRSGAGEIFITAAAEIAQATFSATNRIERATRKPREFAKK
jgi:hypothetical protein